MLIRRLQAQLEKQLTLKQLEKKMGLSQSVTAGILSRIEQKGYVTSYGDPDDRRIKIFCITPLGEQLCEDPQSNAVVDMSVIQQI